MQKLAQEHIEKVTGASDIPQQSVASQTIFMLYEQTEDIETDDDGKTVYNGKGLLQIDLIRKILDMEVKLMKDKRYEKFCLAAAPAVGEVDKNPPCLEAGLLSGPVNLVFDGNPFLKNFRIDVDHPDYVELDPSTW